jgi:uncharacterized protein
MARFVFLALAIWLAIAIIRQLLSHPQPRRQQRPSLGSHDMVRCRHCGLHVPRDEAVSNGDHHYCSEKHRLADRV